MPTDLCSKSIFHLCDKRRTDGVNTSAWKPLWKCWSRYGQKASWTNSITQAELRDFLFYLNFCKYWGGSGHFTSQTCPLFLSDVPSVVLSPMSLLTTDLWIISNAHMKLVGTITCNNDCVIAIAYVATCSVIPDRIVDWWIDCQVSCD